MGDIAEGDAVVGDDAVVLEGVHSGGKIEGTIDDEADEIRGLRFCGRVPFFVWGWIAAASAVAWETVRRGDLAHAGGVGKLARKVSKSSGGVGGRVE